MHIQVNIDNQMIEREILGITLDVLLTDALIKTLKHNEVAVVSNQFRLFMNCNAINLKDIFLNKISKILKQDKLINADEALVNIIITDTEILNWFYCKFIDRPAAIEDLYRRANKIYKTDSLSDFKPVTTLPIYQRPAASAPPVPDTVPNKRKPMSCSLM